MKKNIRIGKITSEERYSPINYIAIALLEIMGEFSPTETRISEIEKNISRII